MFPWLFQQDMGAVRKDLEQLREEVPVTDPVEVEHDLMDEVAAEEAEKKVRKPTDGELVRRHSKSLLMVLQENLTASLREVLEWEQSLHGFGDGVMTLDYPDAPQEVIDTAFVYIDWLKERGCYLRARHLSDALEGVEDSCYTRLRSVRRDSPLRQELRDKATAIGARLDAMREKGKK